MKHVLIVTAFFPPAAFVGAQRPLKLLREIGRFGWMASVLTVARRCAGRYDADSTKRIPTGATVKRVPCWSLWNHSQFWREAKPGMPRYLAKVNRALAKMTQNRVPIDHFYPWSVMATSTGLDHIRRNKVDVIWATCPSLSAAHLAHRLSSRTGVPFAVDFRDVRLHKNAEMQRREKSALAWERRILNSCSAVTYVAPDQIDVLRQKHPQLHSFKSKLVYNWVDPDEIAGISARQFNDPTVVHGGILYGGTRRVDGFLKALVTVNRRTNVSNGKRLRFLQLGGGVSDLEYLNRLVVACGADEAVDIEKSVPHDEFLSACMGAVVLLLVVGRDQGDCQHAGAIPGKLYNYLAAGRPILVIGPPDCEAGRIVTRLRRGLFAPDDQPELISDALCQLVTRQQDFDMSADALGPFSAQVAVKQLADLFEEVLDEN